MKNNNFNKLISKCNDEFTKLNNTTAEELCIQKAIKLNIINITDESDIQKHLNWLQELCIDDKENYNNQIEMQVALLQLVVNNLIQIQRNRTKSVNDGVKMIQNCLKCALYKNKHKD